MARWFLYVIAALVALVVAAAFAYRIWGMELVRFALTPAEPFRRQAAVPADAYRAARMWIARPDIAGNPALWTPPGVPARARPGGAAVSPAVFPAVFFVHPTSYITPRERWNATIGDAATDDRAALFVRAQASAFNAVGEVWAPRYRQAAFGAFLTDAADSARALDLAYGDVSAAFDAFLAGIAPDRPIILAGHSQGTVHLLRLLRSRVAGRPLARRIVAAYAVGWPVSVTRDLPALGLPQCTRPDQAGCLLSWETFAEPADPALILDTYDASTGFDGRPRRGTAMVCTNPLTGTAGGAAPAAANRGTLYPAADLASATMRAGTVPAACRGRGLLMIGSPPDVGAYVLPGNNYHVYDYSLFWANVRDDAARRAAAFAAAR